MSWHKRALARERIIFKQLARRSRYWRKGRKHQPKYKEHIR